MVIEHKSGFGTYNTLISQNNVPICKILQGADTNLYVKILVDTAKEVTGDLIEACTRTGDFKLTNVTFANSSIMSLFPTGLYRSTYRFFNSNDANIVNVTYDTLNVNN